MTPSEANLAATPSEAIEHAGEKQSNAVRRELAEYEPRCLRTYTPSLAVIERSAGSYHYTPEGRKLADFTSGVLVANLGHNPAQWWRGVVEYMGLDALKQAGAYCEAAPLTTYNAATQLEAEATRRLLENLRAQPGGGRMEQVLWSASGSEAIQKGLWASLARAPGRDIILATRRGFHGKKGLAGAVTGSETDKDRDPRVRFISFPTDACRTIQKRREPLDLAPFEAELAALANEYGERLCCLITEPYLGGGGSYHPQPEYLQLLQRFCLDHDLVFILDEIQSNFGRTGAMYAFTHYGVEPDLVALGKGLGNGMPVDAIAGRADVLAALDYGEGSDTWSAHPLGSAAVLATLDAFESGDVMKNAACLAEVIETGLMQLAEQPAIAAVRGEGTVWGVECAELPGMTAEEVANRIVRDAYLGDAQGRAIHLLGPLAGRVIRIAPPLTMDTEEARLYLDVLSQIVKALAA